MHIPEHSPVKASTPEDVKNLLQLPGALERYHPFMQRLLQVGDGLLDRQKKGLQGRMKADRSLVSDADEWSEACIKQFIATHFPDDGMIAEEGTNVASDKRIWTVDPIDGTEPFLQNRPDFGVSVGSQDAGFLVFPAYRELFSAARGKGAFLNEQELVLAPEDTPLIQAKLAVGYTSDRNMYQHYYDVTSPVRRECNYTYWRGSSVEAFRSTVIGHVDGVIVGGACTWDVAAAMVIAQEMGMPAVCRTAKMDKEITVTELPHYAADKIFFAATRSPRLLEEMLLAMSIK
jgi:myo-inositol-1(or 4)-monophosphatase